jgi:hypothetical protein
MESPDKRKRAIRKLQRWLETFGWEWYVRLNIRTGAASTEVQMKELFYDWIAEVERVHGDSDFHWVRVLERGPTKRSSYFLVLIGGLRNRRKDLASRWNFLGGESIIDRYDPDKDGILSMLKPMEDSGRLDIDFKLPKTGVVAPIEGADPLDDEAE